MLSTLTLAADEAPHQAVVSDGPAMAGLILLLPFLAAVLCTLCAAVRVRSKLPAWLTIITLAVAFIVTCTIYAGLDVANGETLRVHLFQWIGISWDGGAKSFFADFALYIDSLTMLWMLFVTGLSTLIALYASEYMDGDRGYARFFGGLSLFVFAMSALVMADNLLLLYLGWEGVGFCSYYLIGFYYQKPSAVAAGKKAFIVNRIGDLGLALGLLLAYTQFGTLQYHELFAEVARMNELGIEKTWAMSAIPYLLFAGAIGKSAQIPLYVWLPDAMEGPTPVSALIHAATMVTAGVYLVARMYPLFLLTPESLTVVAWVGGLTALLAATIGMAQYDIKRVMAYSTVSQLGYMFMGLGVLTSLGACFHVFTHAFFKALLFLACGAVMHGFAGQLDLRRLSGLWNLKGWRITSITMLIGCLALAGVFPAAGFFSKDLILAEAFITPGFTALGIIGVITAGLTGYYTFRVFCRVFAGPTFL
jgi:NADH-quinone oxidoreductase subunit L